MVDLEQVDRRGMVDREQVDRQGMVGQQEGYFVPKLSQKIGYRVVKFFSFSSYLWISKILNETYFDLLTIKKNYHYINVALFTSK